MEVTFSSTLLLALPEFCAGGEFNVMPQMAFQSQDGKSYEKVDIVTLNCKTKDEIVPHLTKMLQTLSELPPSATVVHNTKSISHWLDEIHAGTYEHDVPQYLLEATRNASGMALVPGQMIYLSGVTRLIP